MRVIAKEPLVDFTTAGFETVTIESIIAENGPRIPAHRDAPKHFERGLVIITGAALTFYEHSMDFMTEQDARRIEESFADAVPGRARALASNRTCGG